MAKLIILSVIIVSFAVPIWFAGSSRPRRDLRKVQWAVAAFIVVWSYMCIRWYPDLVPLK
jgi:hypothetical protein